MTCPVSRVPLDSLARSVAPYFPNIPYPVLRSTLRKELNSVYDKSPDGSNPWESVSRAEASWFVLEAQADLRHGGIQPERQTIMTVLQQIFFQGRADWSFPSTQPKFPAQITQCADGDTCRAIIQEDPQCPPLPEILRYSAVDTPESLPSQKLNRVIGEVSQKLAAAYGIPPQVMESLYSLVRFRIQYAGKIASILMKDFEVWLQAQGGNFAVSNSYVNVPSKYQGLWQAYDTYMRRVITLHAPPEAISHYFQTRLPELMATTGEIFYQGALAEYTELFHASPAKFPFLAPQTLLSPASVFTPAVGTSLAAQWQTEVTSTGYGDDWTGAMIFVGAAYYYAKYNNQHGEAYSKFQASSQSLGLGLWQDIVFQVMNPALAWDPTPDPES